MQQDSNSKERELSTDEIQLLDKQNSRLVPTFKAQKFESESSKHWDLFYKRNSTKFFKDRHWTTREFQDLSCLKDDERKTLLEVGCGVGNFLYPLLKACPNLFIFACDFSPRAVTFVKDNPLYDETRVMVFQCDITCDISNKLSADIDVVSMVFVLSAIAPQKFPQVFNNLKRVMNIGGRILFRDYAVNDRAMVRFSPGTKITDRLYLRQDGTTSYFFRIEELRTLAEQAGFDVIVMEYVHRKTVNKKEDVDVERIFLQAVFEKKNI